jgi:hypothetical protein
MPPTWQLDGIEESVESSNSWWHVNSSAIAHVVWKLGHEYIWCWETGCTQKPTKIHVLLVQSRQTTCYTHVYITFQRKEKLQYPKINIQYVLFCQRSTPEAQYSACLVLSAFNTRSSIFSMFCFVSVQHPKFNIQFAKFIFHTTMFNIDIWITDVLYMTLIRTMFI